MNTNEGETDRVRRHSPPESLQDIEHKVEQNVRFHGSRPENEIGGRISQLDNEWSIERRLETNASILALTGVVLGLTMSRKWLLLTAAVSGFLMQHAMTGWCLPVPIFRKLGLRTRGEIDREKFALKAMRGDFKNIPERPKQDGASNAAVKAARA
jgi:hypothetical protein